MKTDRLVGILFTLLQKEKVTAPYLAEKFEVSRRTINRDIEDICKAGIPIVTTQGQNGGISIMEGYRVDHTLFTSSDMQAILAGVRSLDSISGTNRYQRLMDKLVMGNENALVSNNHILIDLSSWYKSSLAPKIELIQFAIEKRQLIKFQYYAPSGDSRREIEPYILVFQWSSWYVWGYCRERLDFRLFKLNRIIGLIQSEEKFPARELPEIKIKEEGRYWEQIKVTAVFQPCMKWRLIEDYGIESFYEQEDGKLLFQFGFADKESLISWFLTFRSEAEILEPEELRKDMKKILEQTLKLYKN